MRGSCLTEFKVSRQTQGVHHDSFVLSYSSQHLPIPLPHLAHPTLLFKQSLTFASILHMFHLFLSLLPPVCGKISSPFHCFLSTFIKYTGGEKKILK